MARLRQLNPSRYDSSGRIHDEFENLVRYINAVENAHGNKTLKELFDVLFDEDGQFAGPISFRFDAENGLQYRVGEYTDSEQGWETLASAEALRGPAGQNLGTIEGPIFFNRQEFEPDPGEDELSYSIDEDTEDVLVFKNGLLLSEDDYTIGASSIALDTAANGTDVFVVYSIRSQQVTNYRREETTAVQGQVVVSFVHDSDEEFLVFRNGLLQRSGGGNDYTSNAATDTITFTTPLSVGEKVIVIVVTNQALRNVAGLMLEDEYTNGSGMIRWDRIAVANDGIPAAKVAGLVAHLAVAAILTVSSSTPSNASAGHLWLDTSVAPNQLKVYDGAQWLDVSPESTLPSFTTADAGKYVRVNQTGVQLEYADIDFSNLVPKTWRGAANGVASLDVTGRLPNSQLPESLTTECYWAILEGAVADDDYVIQRIWKKRIRIVGVIVALSAGTCDVQLTVDGVPVGNVLSATVAITETTLSSAIEIDASTVSKMLGFQVSNQSSAADLEITLVAQVLS